jgi:hypothetical protein
MFPSRRHQTTIFGNATISKAGPSKSPAAATAPERVAPSAETDVIHAGIEHRHDACGARC